MPSTTHVNPTAEWKEVSRMSIVHPWLAKTTVKLAISGRSKACFYVKYS
jgi:hypothetical protein